MINIYIYMINNIYDIYIYDSLYIWHFSNIKNLNYMRIRFSTNVIQIDIW